MPSDREKRAPKQSCDNCRCRKIKCDRGDPCKNCTGSSLQCRYLHVIRRKGPKRGVGRRLTQLRQGLTEIDKGYFNVLTPDTPTPSGFSSSSPDSNQGAECNQNDASSLDFNRQLSLSLVAHIQIFMKHMFPIMPVMDFTEILADAAHLDELTPCRYALVLALCAATRAQLRMDTKENTIGNNEIPPEPQLTAELLLRMAENAQRQYSVIDDCSLDSILMSYFIFVGYGNLNDARHAWFYLNQSTTLLQSLNLTTESGYVNLTETEREVRRRVFWLLFVTERTFALQHRRPVMLRSRVAKPRIVDSECPTVMHDFVNHIRLFDLLPCSLYEWHPEDEEYKSQDASLTNTIQTKLCALQPEKSLIESQRFDTLLTQQWLRVSMWRLAFGKKPSFVHNRELLMPVDIPLDAGKVVMKALNSVLQTSKDCHGIEIEQKLFDIGICLADSAMIPASNFSTWEIGPRDLLCSVTRALSKSRGCQSHLLPLLLQHSEKILGYSNPIPDINLSWSLDGLATMVGDTVVEEPSTQPDESIDALDWALVDDFGLLDTTAAYMSLPIEQAVDST